MGLRQGQVYTEEFKNRFREKVLSRGNRSKADICTEMGVKYSTADNWVRDRVKSLEMKKQKSSSKWTAEQKLNSVIAAASLSEAELGAYLRKEGLFSQQLDEWRKEFLSAMNAIKPRKNAKDERDQKIKNLEREVLRKDKALAEASALLILQKKVNLIWGSQEEEEK